MIVDRAVRGYYSGHFWTYYEATYPYPISGFRPVLEALNPDTLGSDGLKTVALDLNGGSIGDATGTGNIVVKTERASRLPKVPACPVQSGKRILISAGRAAMGILIFLVQMFLPV